MKVMAFNGSPRKNWNTATLLNKAIEGASSQGAETELIHLYDLNYKGCVSCFACKTRGGKNYGKCATKDELTPIFAKVEWADAIILGSPIYFGAHTGLMRSFLERLVFPYTSYSAKKTLFPKEINTGFIYTMNVTESRMKERGYDKLLSFCEEILTRIFGASESIYSYDTYQFDDYSKVIADNFDAEKKAERRREVFPVDCERAYDMGVRFAKQLN